MLLLLMGYFAWVVSLHIFCGKSLRHVLILLFITDVVVLVFKCSSLVYVHHVSTGNLNIYYINTNCLRGLVVRVPGCKCRGPRFDSWSYQIF
jgi:hypothetical protein